MPPQHYWAGGRVLGKCFRVRVLVSTIPEACLCVQLKLEEDIKYLREEMMKTETLQAKEEQTLTEWQVGAQWLLFHPVCLYLSSSVTGKCLSGLQGGKGFLYSAGSVPDLQIEPTQQVSRIFKVSLR